MLNNIHRYHSLLEQQKKNMQSDEEYKGEVKDEPKHRRERMDDKESGAEKKMRSSEDERDRNESRSHR